MNPVTDHPTSITNSHLVASGVLALQPLNGTDYSFQAHHWTRALVALNVHAGFPPLTGLHA